MNYLPGVISLVAQQLAMICFMKVVRPGLSVSTLLVVGVGFSKYIFWASLLALFVAFLGAGLLAFPGQEKSSGLAFVVSLLLTPIFIVLGVLLVSCFKIAIGGHPS
jgi:hypothetical protein